MMLVITLLACGWGAGTPRPEAPAEPTLYHRELVSDTYHIDKKYPSMVGPDGVQEVTLGDGSELLWITGYHVQVVDASTQQAVSQEFMCHANLDFDAEDYMERMASGAPLSGRVFTLSQGQQDISFPDGFGVPILSDQVLSLTTQVLNANLEQPNLYVRHKVRIDYLRAAELSGPLVPLYQAAVEGFKALEDARYYGLASGESDDATHGEGCGVGQAAIAGDFDADALGQKFSAHWVVKPGREVNRTNVTRFLNQPFDTTAHYIAVHLHPFAESLELKDLTTGQVVFKSRVTPVDDRVAIARVEHYSSVQGLPIYGDHEYELVSVYDNPTQLDADSMAVMYLYLRDPTFDGSRMP